MECSYFGLAEQSENCAHECIVTDRCLFWQALHIVASPCEGIVLKNFYFKTTWFPSFITTVLFQISGLECVLLHNGTIFPEFVGPHRNRWGIDATNVNTTFSVSRKSGLLFPSLRYTSPEAASARGSSFVRQPFIISLSRVP